MTDEKVPVLVFSDGDLLYIDCEDFPMLYYSIDFDLVDTGECPICWNVLTDINQKDELIRCTIPVTAPEKLPDGTMVDVIQEGLSREVYIHRITGGDWYCEDCDINWSKIETEDAIEKLRKIRAWEKEN